MAENVTKRFFTKKAALIVVGGFLLILLFARNDSPAPAATSPSNSKVASSTTNEEVEELGMHGIGESKTGVVLIEYGDFASEASKAYQPMMQQIMDKYGDQLRFVYRDFPVESNATSMAAQRSANAVEASQGMFWRMRELLYERQAAWKDNPQAESMFESYAKELGVDMKQYKQALASKSISNAITTDIASGQKLQVSTTPALFINDKVVPANITFDDLSKLIDEAIAANYKPAS